MGISTVHYADNETNNTLKHLHNKLHPTGTPVERVEYIIELLLMEKVFANSNFTNNVKGGVIAEVIGLVNEIDEQWVLKTDLLCDAIELALSETVGTKSLKVVDWTV